MRLIIEEEYKTCSKCKEVFPATLEYFYKQKITKPNEVIYKLTSYCKECQKTKSKKWVSNNRDKHNEAQKRYFHTDKGRSTRNYENDKERLRQWQIDNPERVKYHREKRLENKTHEISKDEWEECKKYFNHRCAYCDLKIEDHFIQHRRKTILGDFHREHLIHDGANNLSNCVPSCKSCNSSKGDFIFEDWYLVHREFSEERQNKMYDWINNDYKKYLDK